jgi:hypothetical protein
MGNKITTQREPNNLNKFPTVWSAVDKLSIIFISVVRGTAEITKKTLKEN